MNSAVPPGRWRTPSAKLAKGGGSTNIISLAAIKREAGARWDKMSEAIGSRLEVMLRQRLGPSDFFVPIDVTTYLVVMPSSTPEEGQICCLRIAYELHSSLLGSCRIEHLEIARAEVVGEDVLEMRPFSHAEVVHLARKADLDLSAPLARFTGASDAPDGSVRMPEMAAPPRAEIEVKYLPVWDAPNQVIRAYRCASKRRQSTALASTPSGDARQLAETLLVTLQRVSDVLVNHLAHNERFIINLPICYDVLSSPLVRMQFTSACRQLPCQLRPYLVFKLDGLPIGVPHVRLVDLVSSISPFCRAVIAKAPLHLTSWEAYRGVGLKALGLGLRPMPFDEASHEIDKLCAETKRTGLSSFLDDVPDTSVLQYGLSKGVQWISGASIIRPVAEPGPLVRLSLESILRGAAA